MTTFFENLLRWIIYGSIATTAIVVYLSINKMWIRKHESVVAESVSTSAQIISFVTILPFVVNYALREEYGDSLYQFLWLFYTGFLILVGVGFWVQDSSHLGFWQKLAKGVSQDQSEFGNLAKALGRSGNSAQLMDILQHLAWLDGRLDDRERSYIEAFATSLQLELNLADSPCQSEDTSEQFVQIRQLTEGYLEQKPPIDEVNMLGDLIQALIAVDDEITQEEDVVAAEITSLLQTYSTGELLEVFGVVIHPKDEQQTADILELSPHAQWIESLGSKALTVCQFNTRRFAELSTEMYRSRGWFTVVHPLIGEEKLHDSR